MHDSSLKSLHFYFFPFLMRRKLTWVFMIIHVCLQENRLVALKRTFNQKLAMDSQFLFLIERSRNNAENAPPPHKKRSKSKLSCVQDKPSLIFFIIDRNTPLFR